MNTNENKSEWAKIVTNILKAELAKRGVDYQMLIHKLKLLTLILVSKTYVVACHEEHLGQFYL